MNIHATASDIRSQGAYSGTSYSPERREASQKTDYLAHMAEVAERFSQWETPDNAEAMAEDLEAYRSGYAARLNGYLSSHSRIVSQFVTGAGGWTAAMVRSNNKKIDSADNKLRDLIEWSDKRREKLRNRYDPRSISRQAIRSGDADALERLAEKIERLEAYQETMKAVNKIIRSKETDDEKVEAMICLDGISEAKARKLLQRGVMGNTGFASFELTNNGANIRRLKERYITIERKQAQDEANGERRFDFDGGYVLDNPDADRYQVFHDSKPASDVIAKLKSYGMRWTPSAGCWQAYRSWSGSRAIEAVTGVKVYA